MNVRKGPHRVHLLRLSCPPSFSLFLLLLHSVQSPGKIYESRSHIDFTVATRRQPMPINATFGIADSHFLNISAKILQSVAFPLFFSVNFTFLIFLLFFLTRFFFFCPDINIAFLSLAFCIISHHYLFYFHLFIYLFLLFVPSMLLGDFLSFISLCWLPFMIVRLLCGLIYTATCNDFFLLSLYHSSSLFIYLVLVFISQSSQVLLSGSYISLFLIFTKPYF